MLEFTPCVGTRDGRRSRAGRGHPAAFCAAEIGQRPASSCRTMREYMHVFLYVCMYVLSLPSRSRAAVGIRFTMYIRVQRSRRKIILLGILYLCSEFGYGLPYWRQASYTTPIGCGCSNSYLLENVSHPLMTRNHLIKCILLYHNYI